MAEPRLPIDDPPVRRDRESLPLPGMADEDTLRSVPAGEVDRAMDGAATERPLKLHTTLDPWPDGLGELELRAAETVQDEGADVAPVLVTKDLLDVGTNPEPEAVPAVRTAQPLETPPPRPGPAALRPAAGVTGLFGRDERDLSEGPEGPPARTALWPVAAALMVGIALGFGGGYRLGGWRVGPTPAPAATALPGREWTEGAVNEPAKETSRVVPSRPDSSSRDGAAARAEPGAAVSPGHASRLLVQSTPAGARVFVDGREQGRTPATVLDLPRGPHRLRLARAGYADEDRRIVVTAAGSTQSVMIELKRPAAIAPAAARAPAPLRQATPDLFTGTALSVDSRPGGARVFIDGRLVGMTPISVAQVGAGAHAIRLERDGYRRWSSSIRMVAGEPNRVTASLER
jgi:hypothetical protein